MSDPRMDPKGEVIEVKQNKEKWTSSLKILSFALSPTDFV